MILKTLNFRNWRIALYTRVERDLVEYFLVTATYNKASSTVAEKRFLVFMTFESGKIYSTCESLFIICVLFLLDRKRGC